MQRQNRKISFAFSERMDSWALMVALIGEGQEIHPGEESGLVQWNDFVIGDAETMDGSIARRRLPMFLRRPGNWRKFQCRTNVG
jgi:hypothetical protein